MSWTCDETNSHQSLTIIVDGKGYVGGDDVIEAYLAVLGGTVCIESLHTHDAVEQAAFWDGRFVATLHKHGGEFVDVVHTHMDRGPGGREGGDREKG